MPRHMRGSGSSARRRNLASIRPAQEGWFQCFSRRSSGEVGESRKCVHASHHGRVRIYRTLSGTDNSALFPLHIGIGCRIAEPAQHSDDLSLVMEPWVMTCRRMNAGLRRGPIHRSGCSSNAALTDCSSKVTNSGLEFTNDQVIVPERQDDIHLAIVRLLGSIRYGPP